MVTEQTSQPANRRQSEIADDPGRGACGIVALADLDGRPRRELIADALTGLRRMEHRGGVVDGTGDGAGVLFRPERSFFERFLPPERRLSNPDEPLIVGTLAFLPGERNIHEYQREVDAILRRSGLTPLGWRKVPVDLDVLDPRARNDAPLLYQLLCAKGHRLESHLPRILFQTKGQLEERFGGGLVVTSLAPYTTVYKALTDAATLPRFFPDLTDPELTCRVVVGHRRFATNTFSSWHLAQPFQLLAHNGEINTITANCRAVRDVDSAVEIGAKLMRHGSDSAHVDRVVEMMAVGGMSGIAEALRRIMPPSWEEDRPGPATLASPSPGSSERRNPGADAERERQFFTANRRAMGTLGAWEGPAAIAATDGQVLVGILDRMGLRPLRYLETRDRRVVIASEMGAVPVPADQIARDGQLEPGEMVIADLEAGELILPDRCNRWILERTGLNFGGLATEDLLPVTTGVVKELSVTSLNKFGWTKERIQRLRQMVKQSSPLVHSMGNDLPLAIFSENRSRLYSFFNQIVAVITNPPIDPLREGGAMDTTVFLGRSPRVTRHADYVGWPQYQLDHPVLTNEQVAGVMAGGRDELVARRLDATMAPTEDPWDLAVRIDELANEAVARVRDGVSILVVSDVAALDSDRLPLPMLLVVGALHRALANFGLRRDASVVVETAEVHEGHDLAVLLAYGATAVNPYAMLHLAGDMPKMDQDRARTSLVEALVDGLRRIMSKMGITSLTGYRGSALFEAIGVSGSVVEYFIPDTVTRLGGLELDDIYRDLAARASSGDAGLKRNLNVAVYRKEVTTALQLVARNGNREGDYDRFVALLDATPPVYLRDLLDLRWIDSPLAIDQVVGADEIIRTTLRGSAMSHGALHSTAHRAIAAAFNHFGSRSNSGEGGEDERRNPNGEWAADRNRTRQVASGRFGVDAGYLIGADEIEIKIGQGAKPGEGGHLPANKVTAEIARIRKVAPGVTLISPPPHHDIYSIEDIAQLILHLREVNPAATIAVKVPSITNLGTIAVGIVKAGADTIAISGFEGGTGAAYVGSILHAGLPLDRGVAEVHQYLVVNGVRDRVRLRADGGLKRGLDVAKILALGADEVSFGTSLMVAENCIYCRGCSKGKCPAGLATQDEGLQARFMRRHREERIDAESSIDERYQEARAGVIRYLECVAEDLRAILARLGLRHPTELVGRTDLMAQRRTGNPRWDRLDLTELTHRVEGSPAEPSPESVRRSPLEHNHRIVAAAGPALCGETEQLGIDLTVDTDAHAIGATLAGVLARTPAATGRRIEIRTHGYAGQGLGFAATSGMTLIHRGYANDTVAEVMSGTARVVVVPPSPQAPAHLVGNAAAYGATGGILLVAGTAGQRFGVRNSGATLVCHGVGKYAFEYMTGGVGVVLGACGPVIGSGMTGGQLFLLRADGAAPRLHRDVTGVPLAVDQPAAAVLEPILRDFAEATGSPVAEQILAGWPATAAEFVHVTPTER